MSMSPHALTFAGNFDGRTYFMEIYDRSRVEEENDQNKRGAIAGNTQGEDPLPQHACVMTRRLYPDENQRPFFLSSPGSYRASFLPIVDGATNFNAGFFCDYDVSSQTDVLIELALTCIQDGNGAIDQVEASFIPASAAGGDL